MTFGPRWTAQRKQAVLHQIDTGMLSLEEAWSLYGLSEEELTHWRVNGTWVTKTPKALRRNGRKSQWRKREVPKPEVPVPYLPQSEAADD